MSVKKTAGFDKTPEVNAAQPPFALPKFSFARPYLYGLAAGGTKADNGKALC